jgi:SIR2-like domain
VSSTPVTAAPGSSKPKLVVVLGAGASADFGVPTLRGVFNDKQARLHLKKDPWLLQQLEETFWRPRGHTLETSHQSLTVEEMLTILRDWRKEESVPHCLTEPDQERFRRSLYVLIEKALFEGKSTRAEYLNPLIAFARANFSQVTWASFNWDCVFESSFWYTSGPPEPPGSRCNPYLVVNIANWRDGPSNHVFLKLHGGINWWMISGKLKYVRFTQVEMREMWDPYAVGTAPEPYPVILEPSYYKYQDDPYPILEPQWNEFLKRLIAADCILIVGYSLPDGDGQARSKMLTAFQANADSQWAIVDPNPEVCARYDKLLGRSRLKVFPVGLAGFNNALEDSMREAFRVLPREESSTSEGA